MPFVLLGVALIFVGLARKYLIQVISFSGKTQWITVEVTVFVGKPKFMPPPADIRRPPGKDQSLPPKKEPATPDKNQLRESRIAPDILGGGALWKGS